MKPLQHHRVNIAGSFIFLAIGIVIFAQMVSLKEEGASSDPGAAGYPMLIGGLMIVLAVLLAFQRDKNETFPPRSAMLRVLAAVAVIFVYISLMAPLGYVISTVLFLIATMLLMGIRSMIPLIATAIGLTLINFYLFYLAFGVPLPTTFIERLLS